jgi:hypothetical protein
LRTGKAACIWVTWRFRRNNISAMDLSSAFATLGAVDCVA